MSGFRISKRARSGFLRGREPLRLHFRWAADAIAWLTAPYVAIDPETYDYPDLGYSEIRQGLDPHPRDMA